MKQLNLNKLSDGSGFKDADVGAAKNQFLSSFVYERLFKKIVVITYATIDLCL